MMSGRMRKNWIVGVLICVTVFSIFINIDPVSAKSNYKKEYYKVVQSSTAPNKYADFSYEERYFGETVSFSEYFTYDLDKNGIPELFVKSDNTGLWAVFTYADDEVVCLTFDNLWRINKKTNEIVVWGHWHGAGGTGENEYFMYKMKKDKKSLKCSYSIDDHYGSAYPVYVNDWEKHYDSKSKYKAIYQKHVKNAIDISKFKTAKVGTKKGIK